jgi:subtilisin family serine protease
MKRFQFFRFLLFAATGALLMLVACEKEEAVLPGNGGDEIADLKAANGNGAASYIVVLNDRVEAEANLTSVRGYERRQEQMTGYLNRFLSGHGVGPDQLDLVYTNVYPGFAARLNARQVARLQADPRVKSITPDQVVTLVKPTGKPSPQPPTQSTPWGITRVGGATNYTGTYKAWVIDTGIDLDHPDLNVHQTLGKSFVSRVTSPNDDNGHGSHCAGIIAAKNNEVGVVGVAAGATVVPVKVLDRRGSGYMSWIIAGVDYVAADEKGKAGDVANLSLGGGAYTDLDNAVIALGSKGIKVSIAAGNSGAPAINYSPARANGTNLYTISAMDINNNFASFSNFGNPPIEYCAPGVSILSCYKDAGYTTMSGTSMAAPHVAGLLLLGEINSGGQVNGDPDGNPDVIAHK